MRVCGPVRLGDGDAAALRPKERAVLAALAFDHPHPTSTDRLVELVWGEQAPATAHKSVHNHMARLRQVLADVVITDADGYRLSDDVELDLDHLEQLVRGGRGAGAGDPSAPGVRHADVLSATLDDVRGVAFADLPDGAEVMVRRLHHHRLVEALRDAYVQALLAEDRNAPAVVAARDLVESAPDSEHRWWLLVLALSRCGRRREALHAVAGARRRLADAGLDLGADLLALERLVANGDPVVASPSILRRPQHRGVSDPTTNPVGIAQLLDELQDWLDAASPPSVRTLVGPAGSGKTTISGAVVAEALRRDMHVIVTGCDPEPSTPLQPIVEVLEDLAARSPEWFDVDGLTTLGVLSGALARRVGAADPLTDHQDLLEAVRRAFEKVPRRPTLLVVEDVHWAPPLTVQALAAAASGCRTGSHARLLLTSRPAEDGGDLPVPGPVVEVPVWGVDDVREWLEPHEPDAVRRADAARWLHAQTGGTPLFVRELTLHLLGERRLGPGAVGPFAPPADAPPVVMAALAARTDRLSKAGAHALEVAAVAGARAHRDVLLAVPGVSPAGLDEVVRSRMLLPSGAEPDVVRFEHELLRRVALDRLAPATAAEVHHLVLVALDSVGPEGSVAPAVRAHHAVAAASIDAARAVRAAHEAASVAAHSRDHAEAGSWWLTAAAVLAERIPHAVAERLDRCVRAGEALIRVGDPRSEEILFDAATTATETGDLETAARAATAVCRLGPTSMAGRPHDEATALCDDLLARIDSPRLRAPLAAATTMVHSMAGAHGRCRELFDQAERDAEADGSDEVLIDVLPFSYMSLSAPADLERRERISDRLLQAGRRIDRPDGQWSALHLRFSNQLQRGDPALRDTADEMVALAPRVRERQRDWETCYVRATVAFVDDRLDDCEAAITETLHFVDTVAESRIMAVYGVQLLALRYVQRRLHELVDTIAALAEDQPTVGAWKGALALAAAQAGRHDLAGEAFDAAMADDAAALAPDYSYTGALVALAEAAVLIGDPTRAAAVAPLLEPWAGRWSWVGTCTLGPLDTSRARVAALCGDLEAAVRAGDDALASARRLRAPAFVRLAQASFPHRSNGARGWNHER